MTHAIHQSALTFLGADLDRSQATVPERTGPATGRGEPSDGERTAQREQLVVLGGGAGGLELVVKLARRLRRDRSVDVVLVDRNPTHIWKPLFHEVATGSLNSAHDEASYRLLARKHGFRFVLGQVERIDGEARQLHVAAMHDDAGRPLSRERLLDYGQLVVAVGSQSNDFGIGGVREYSRQLDTRMQAERFHRHFAAELQRVYAHSPTAALSVAIVGGGATGVELAADMHNVIDRLRDFGFEHFSRERLSVTIIEATPGLLPRLPGRVGAAVEHELAQLGVTVRTGTRVARVEADHLLTSDGERIDAGISVWAAGVRAPSWLAQCGFPVDHLGRIRVHGDLTVHGYANVFAIGDCCACDTPDGKEIPPRAQAAHQMAATAARNVVAARYGRRLRPFRYRDLGSLVNLGRYSTVGNLMGNLMRGSWFVEGWMARMMYLLLYRQHQAAIYGPLSMLMIMLGDRIYRATRAEVKLH